MNKRKLPPLYYPSTEHDSCGVGFIASLTKEPSHKVIEMGLEALDNLTHRGAVGGDRSGAGIVECSGVRPDGSVIGGKGGRNIKGCARCGRQGARCCLKRIANPGLVDL